MDALSDDGRQGMTVIAFIGSVFSPYYRWARRHGPVDPTNHCALNVVLYSARDGRWTMTERGSGQIQRDASSLSIDRSTLSWNGSSLEVNVDEICAPLPRRLRGTICVTPKSLQHRSFALDAGGLHHWTPHAPSARVELNMQDPAVKWSGTGYFDSNSGSAPLEDTFSHWTWSRVSLSDRTVVFYDTQPHEADARTLALQFGANGNAEPIDPPRAAPLPRTRWGLPRSTRCNDHARVVKTLLDAPFYSRSHLAVGLGGGTASAIHESLSLTRFRSAWVQCMLPFRMPRFAR